MHAAPRVLGERSGGLARATLVMLGGVLGAQALIAVATWWLARRLDADTLGTYGFLVATASTIGGVAAFGPGIALARRLAVGRVEPMSRELATAAATALTLAATAALAEALAGPIFATTAAALSLMALVAVASAVQATALQAMLGRERFGSVSVARALGGVITAIGLWVAALESGLLGALAAWAVGLLVSSLVAVRGAPSPPATQRVSLHGAAVEADTASSPWSSGWAFVAAALASPMLWGAQALVATANRAEMARLAVLVPVATAMLLVPGQASQAMIAPMVRGEWQLVRRSGAVIALVTGAVPALALAASAPWWTDLVLPGDAALASVAAPLLVGVAVQAAMSPFVRLLEARASTLWTVALNAGWAAVLLSLTWADRTAIGYARAVALAFTVHGVALVLACRAVARRDADAD